MQTRTSKTMNKTPKKYSRSSSRGYRKYRVQMTFLVSVTKNKDMSSTSLKTKEKEEKENLLVNPNKIQKPKYKNICMKITNK